MGRSTVRFTDPPVIINTASVAGKKEGEGPLGKVFDVLWTDDLNGEKSWEKAEAALVKQAFQLVLQKANKKEDDLDYYIGGDLLDQVSATIFGLNGRKVPFFGIYGACSTFGEALSLSAMLIDGGFANLIAAGASSHFCGAEKQFRFPLDMGTQRPLTSTWTVTGDGTALIAKEGNGPVITHITTGQIMDLGIKDANHMGAAMAPAAAQVLVQHFKDTGRKPSDYDLIATGDLGYVGKELVKTLVAEEGYQLDGSNFTDCGIEIFDRENQDTHCGGSGCACSALTFCGSFYRKLKEGEINRMLLVPTGALMSPTSSQQGEPIPSIAHGVVIESRC